MIRTISVYLTFCLTLTVGAVAALPAMAQETVRTHNAPPAPTPGERDHRTVKSPPPAPVPTDDRDQRRTFARDLTPGQPIQWGLRGADRIDPNTRYALYNLRRAELGEEAQLAFYDCGSSSVCNDATRWNPNGGMFEFRRAPSPDEKGAIVVDEYVSIYNTKTQRFLALFGTWADEPQYIWQLRGLKADAVGRSISFSLYNSRENAYLILRENGIRTFLDNQTSDLSLMKGPSRLD